jgi:hypothetical protein
VRFIDITFAISLIVSVISFAFLFRFSGGDFLTYLDDAVV